jgi:hypothetical protein
MTVYEVLATGFFWHVLTVVIALAFWCGYSFGSIREKVVATTNAVIIALERE